MSQQMSQQSDFLTPQDQMVSTKSGADHADDLHNARVQPASKKVKLTDGLETIATLRDDLPAGEPERQDRQPIADCCSNPFLQYFPELKVDEAELKKRKRKGARDQGALTASQMDRDFVYIGEVASGSFGSVVKVRKRMDGCLYAVKRLKRRVPDGAHKLKNKVLAEVFALSALSQLGSAPSLITYYDSWMEDGHLYIQLEFAHRGSLAAQIKSLPVDRRRFGNDRLMELARQIAQGLMHLHEHGMAHLDLKPDNILECKEGQFKLCDFGLTALIGAQDESAVVTPQEGDNRYVPQEALEDRPCALDKIDMFSFGATLYEVAWGHELPKNGPEWHAIRDGDLQELPHLDGLLRDLIKQMLHRDPAQRPSAEEVYSTIADRGSQAEAQRHQLQQMSQENARLRHMVDSLQQQLAGHAHMGRANGAPQGTQGMPWGTY
jgi:wee1-like protein kinase